jgi:MATE family multidrug resistance protein
MSHMAQSVVDSVMVGRLGAVPLAGVSVAVGIFNVLLVFGIGLSLAVSTLSAHARGRGNPEEGAKVLLHGFWVCLLSGLLMQGLLMLGLPWVSLLKQKPEVEAQMRIYLQALGYSFLPIMLFQAFRQFIEGLEWMKPALWIAVLSIPLNAGLNSLLIFGRWGFPAMGVEGAALATAIARWVMALAMMAYVLSHRELKVYWTHRFRLSLVRIQPLLRMLMLGLSSAFQYIFETSAFAGAAVVIGWLGAEALAAHQVAINIASMSFMVAVGISASASIRIGYARGLGDMGLARRIGWVAMGMTVVLMGLCALVFVVWNRELPALYLSDPIVLRMASTLLLIAAAFQLVDGLQALGVGLLRGMEDKRIPTLLVLVAYWVVALPLGTFLVLRSSYGLYGMWMALAGGLLLSAIFLILRFLSLTATRSSR